MDDQRDLTAGIVCDNYKVNFFSSSLKKEGYEFETVPLVNELSNQTNLKVKFKPGEYKKLCLLVESMERDFKRRN